MSVRAAWNMPAPTAQCSLCQRSSPPVAAVLSVCADCIRQQPGQAHAAVRAAQRASRQEFGLAASPPTGGDVACPLCVNACQMAEGERGFCNLREARGGKLIHLAGTPARGLLHWYFDPLPTNCVADWVCEGHTQRGRNNLAVFYGACTFNCLFCQNWHYRQMSPAASTMSAQELADCADARTFCVCYFGGDPAAQMPHALATSRILARRGVRICWETNGSMHPRLLDQAVQLSLETGGCLKFDVKAFDEHLHRALTGVTNKRTLENLAHAASFISQRPDPPLVMVSTLLVPGYVDAEEVSHIARFIAGLNPDIPYSLLGFHPHFFMPDLPRTSVRHAQEAETAAHAAGLTRVRVGNRHLLSLDY
jgi:pyruvate formate lyase activating enzyme